MTDLIWPKSDFSAVPYRVFVDQDIFERERERIFKGPVWCYLGLEAEVEKPRDFITTFIGDTSVVVNRDDNGELHAFVNRCAHRGSTLVRESCGQRRVHTCVYHHWCYNLQGQLIGVPFEHGIDGKGGMPENFDKGNHGLEKIHIDTYRGVIFGTMCPDGEPLETYLDQPMRDNLDRLFCRPIEILGYMRQRMTSNWKLYWENVCDPYHAGLLHQFAATFGLFRITQGGGTVLDAHARHMINYSLYESDDQTTSQSHYDEVPDFDTSMSLRDQNIVQFRDETGERDAINVMAIYPSLVAARIVNTLSTRQIRPKGPDEFELHWTCFGYTDDDAQLREMRLQQANILGPAGLIAMEDAESGVLVQRAARRSPERCSTLQMGGLGAIESQDHQVTEMPIRGVWRNYCNLMNIETEVHEH